MHGSNNNNDSYARKLIAAAERELRDSDGTNEYNYAKECIFRSMAYSFLAIAAVIVNTDEPEEMYDEE